MAASAPVTGTATVTVACKLPHGLVCRIHAKTKMSEAVPGGFRDIEPWYPTGEEFVLNGNAYPQNVGPKEALADGFALTRGIPKDLWDKWLEQNKRLPAVVNGMIFAHEHQGKTIDEAKEKAKVRTGLERIDPLNLPPEFSRIRMADEQKAKPQAVAA